MPLLPDCGYMNTLFPFVCVFHNFVELSREENLIPPLSPCLLKDRTLEYLSTGPPAHWWKAVFGGELTPISGWTFAWAMESESNNLRGRNEQTHCSSEQSVSELTDCCWSIPVASKIISRSRGKSNTNTVAYFDAVANSRISLTIFIQPPADFVSLPPC